MSPFAGRSILRIPMRRKTMRHAQVAIAILMALVTTVPVAQAQDGVESERLASTDLTLTDLPDVAAPKIDDPISEAELEDLQTFAIQEGMLLEEAIDGYAWRDNFAVAVNTVQQEYPGAFAGAAIVDARGAWVGFEADAPGPAIGIIDTFEKAHPEIAVQVRSHVGFSEVELGEAVAAVHYATLEAAGVGDASTVFDYETRQITSTVVFDSVGAAAVDEVRNGATGRLVDSGLENLLDSIAINVVESTLPTFGGVDDNSAHIGGEAISTCTSGWSVSHWDGRSGIVTAGHCQAAQSDDGRALTHQTFHEGMFGDYQWHTGPQTEPDDFYSGNDTQLEVNRRDVAGAANPVVGQVLCKNGKTTFKSCDTVRATQICYAGYCNLVEMENQRADSGDSGGPWFYNYTAYGVHHGWFWDPFPIQRNLFSKALSAFNALGVSIKR